MLTKVSFSPQMKIIRCDMLTKVSFSPQMDVATCWLKYHFRHKWKLYVATCWLKYHFRHKWTGKNSIIFSIFVWRKWYVATCCHNVGIRLSWYIPRSFLFLGELWYLVSAPRLVKREMEGRVVRRGHSSCLWRDSLTWKGLPDHMHGTFRLWVQVFAATQRRWRCLKVFWRREIGHERHISPVMIWIVCVKYGWNVWWKSKRWEIWVKLCDVKRVNGWLRMGEMNKTISGGLTITA